MMNMGNVCRTMLGMMLAVFLSVSCAVAAPVSKLGIDYSEYGDMAANLKAGEPEFLQSIKAETGEDRSDLIELWVLSLEELYSVRDEVEIDGGLIDFFQEFTPNMVKSWKGMAGIYGLMAENQQATRENEQETRLYNALHGLK